MTNIVEVYELEGTNVSKIYRFAGNDTDSTPASKSDIPVKIINAVNIFINTPALNIQIF